MINTAWIKWCGFAAFHLGLHYLHKNQFRNVHSCIDNYSYSCLKPLSNERKSMFKSGDSRAV